MKSKIKIVAGAILISFLLVNFTSAALVICGRSDQKATSTTKTCSVDQLVNQVVGIMNFLIDSAALLAIGYVLYGGVSMILARGNSAKFGEAKNIMSTAIQGLIIVLIAYLIVSFVIAFLTGGKTFQEIFNFIPHQ